MARLSDSPGALPMSETQPDLREALAYLTPHPSTKGPVILDPVKMRSAVSALQAEVERLQKVEGEREKDAERVPSGPCWSDKPEPQSVSALRATITSRGPATSDLRASLADVDRLLSWGQDYGASLRRHVSWLKTIGGTALPGTEVVISEIEKDIGINFELLLKLHDHRVKLRKNTSAPCDRSGEADATRRGSAEGESTVTGAARQAPSDNPLTETKEGSDA